jgi:CHAD domain-containing protein
MGNAGVESMTERERKFEVGLHSPVPALEGVASVARQAEPRASSLDATYFDTRDHRLTGAGITLRRRTGGEDEGWHLKLPFGEDTRDEVRVALGKERDRVPQQLADLVRAHTHGRKLVPIARLKTARSEYGLIDVEGRTVATLADDHVTGAAAGSIATLDQWREWEIELTDAADGRLLDALTEALADRDVTPSGASSKLGRLLGTAPSPAGSAKVGKRSDAGTVVSAYLRSQVAALRRNDIGVRRDAEDAVHQMRVATRRLRSALGTFRRVLDRDATRDLSRELKWLAGVLGAARDTEVMHENLAAQLDALPPELVMGPVRERLDTYFAGEAAAARATALEALNGTRYDALQRSLDRLVEKPPLRKKARRRADDELRHAIRRANKQLVAAVREVGEAGAAADLDERLHKVRKKAKQARYAADAARPAFGARLKKWRSAVKAIQGTLGDRNDIVVARDVLADLAREAHRCEENAFSYGLLHGRGTGRANELHRTFDRQWRELASGPASRWPA